MTQITIQKYKYKNIKYTLKMKKKALIKKEFIS